MTSKRSLNLALTEPFVFLHAGDDSSSLRRRRQMTGGESTSMLRGVLSLKLSKPMQVTSIEAELIGETRTEWPEGESHEPAPSSFFGGWQCSYSVTDRNRLTTGRTIPTENLSLPKIRFL